MVSKKKRNMVEIAKYMDALPPDLIAVKLGMQTNTVERYMGEILDGRIDHFKSKDYTALVEQSHHQYEMLKQEGWTLYLRATDNKDRATALEKIRQAQSAEDQLFKLCGIYKEININLNIEALMQTPQYKQMMSGIVDFLVMEGIEPAKLFTYLEERERNPERPADAITIEPVTQEDIKTSNKVQMDDYELHRRERKYNREKGTKDIRLGFKNRSMYQSNPEKLGIDEIHFLEAKEMCNNLDEEGKARLEELRRKRDCKDGLENSETGQGANTGP